MGTSSSSNRRNQNPSYYQNPHHHQPLPSQQLASYSDPYPAPTPFAYSPHPPPPIYNSYNPGRPNLVPHYGPYHNHGGWAGIRPPPVSVPQPPPPPYVDHQQAKKVRNDVNVHKGTLRLEVDEYNPDHHLVSFVFDAMIDGSFTIFYFAKEESNCRFFPLYPEVCEPFKFPFQKGVGQKFSQPSGTGIDLGFFELDDLSKPSAKEDVFPLVISAETCLPSVPTKGSLDDPSPSSSPHMQITQAVIQKNDQTGFQVKVFKQILWIDGIRYELREIFGIENSAAESFKDDDPGK
ncbi:hypothetical protein C3L33_12758, partial [Rhododendron williamsianum]